MNTIFGYTFRNKALLEEALTTPSYRMTNPGATDNQRLEFLGDAVLGFLAAENLYAARPHDSEGELTVRRTHMVSTAPLCEAAARVDLAPLLKRNRGAGELPKNAKTLADAIEAILGAAWLDGGLPAARTIFAALALDVNAEIGAWRVNPKGDLQVRAQAMTPPQRPTYTLLGVSGKAHDPLFTVRVTVKGLGSAEGQAHSRKEAESAAAEKLLSHPPTTCGRSTL